jgi:hypothetical protein
VMLDSVASSLNESDVAARISQVRRHLTSDTRNVFSIIVNDSGWRDGDEAVGMAWAEWGWVWGDGWSAPKCGTIDDLMFEMLGNVGIVECLNGCIMQISEAYIIYTCIYILVHMYLSLSLYIYVYAYVSTC